MLEKGKSWDLNRILLKYYKKKSQELCVKKRGMCMYGEPHRIIELR